MSDEQNGNIENASSDPFLEEQVRKIEETGRAAEEVARLYRLAAYRIRRDGTTYKSIMAHGTRAHEKAVEVMREAAKLYPK